jgi:hypothetical protein
MSQVRKCHNADCENNYMGIYCECCEITLDEYGLCECYMPPRTNFDKITESEEALAKLIIDTVTKCQFNECEDCPLYEVDGCSRQEKVIEWLQKECENG